LFSICCYDDDVHFQMTSLLQLPLSHWKQILKVNGIMWFIYLLFRSIMENIIMKCKLLLILMNFHFAMILKNDLKKILLDFQFQVEFKKMFYHLKWRPKWRWIISCVILGIFFGIVDVIVITGLSFFYLLRAKKTTLQILKFIFYFILQMRA
jgi:hypothetical protein